MKNEVKMQDFQEFEFDSINKVTGGLWVNHWSTGDGSDTLDMTHYDSSKESEQNGHGGSLVGKDGYQEAPYDCE